MDLASQPGVHCSLKQCSRISFLPINCVDCSLQFCEEHYLSDQHDCSSPSSKTLTDQELTQRLIEKNQRAGTLSGRLPCQAPKCKGFSLHIEREEQGINFKHQAPRCERCRGLFCMSHRSSTAHNCKAPAPPTQGNIIRSEKDAKKAAMKALLAKNFPQKS